MLAILILMILQAPPREPRFIVPVGLPSVDFSPALNLLEQVRLRVDLKSGKVVKRRRTKQEQEREKAAGAILRAARQIAHSLETQ